MGESNFNDESDVKVETVFLDFDIPSFMQITPDGKTLMRVELLREGTEVQLGESARFSIDNVSREVREWLNKPNDHPSFKNRHFVLFDDVNTLKKY
ncbi:MAG: hypothetical protein Q8L51_02400 [Candidatus Amesbacteria bacterium]|nr:hypothetical protein [Candidatus Amesbacteria bacterium]